MTPRRTPGPALGTCGAVHRSPEPRAAIEEHVTFGGEIALHGLAVRPDADAGPQPDRPL